MKVKVGEKNRAAKERDVDSSPNTFTHVERESAKSARAERAKRRQTAKFGDIDIEEIPARPAWADMYCRSSKRKKRQGDQPQHQTAPKKANYTENDIQAVSQSSNLLNQPCTIIDGQMTSGYITLNLPPLPTKLGIMIEYNPIFSFIELKNVSDTSPIALQIPMNFRTNCFITSIETKDEGCVIPTSAEEFIDVILSVRACKDGSRRSVVVTFAKNPMVLYIPTDDPLHKPALRPAVNGTSS